MRARIAVVLLVVGAAVWTCLVDWFVFTLSGPVALTSIILAWTWLVLLEVAIDLVPFGMAALISRRKVLSARASLASAAGGVVIAYLSASAWSQITTHEWGPDFVTFVGIEGPVKYLVDLSVVVIVAAVIAGLSFNRRRQSLDVASPI